MKNIIPTKGNLLQLKKSIQLATTGYELMDKKRVVLIKEMTLMLGKVREVRKRIEVIFAKAYLSLQDANITLGVINEITKSIPIDNGVSFTFRSVMGVDIPQIHYVSQPMKLPYSISSTNTKFDFAFQNFIEVKQFILELAEIDTVCFRLANEIIKTQKRANALKNIVIPDYQDSYHYIVNVLEEKEREEFVRSKVIKSRIHKN
jgi:V/A-type H+-transporting ATPase subunit D